MKNFNETNFLYDINILVSTINNVQDDKWDPEKVKDKFLDGFAEIVNLHAPLRPQTRKETRLKTKPWITKSILKSIQKKNAMFKQCYKKNDESSIKNYKNYCNLLTSVKRAAKLKYYTNMIEMNKKNFSKQWKLINEILQRNRNQKDPINKLVTDNNVILTEC